MLLLAWKFLEVCWSAGYSYNFHWIGPKLMAPLCGTKQLWKCVFNALLALTKLHLKKWFFSRQNVKTTLFIVTSIPPQQCTEASFHAKVASSSQTGKDKSTFWNVEIGMHHTVVVRRQNSYRSRLDTTLYPSPTIISEKWLPFWYTKFQN